MPARATTSLGNFQPHASSSINNHLDIWHPSFGLCRDEVHTIDDLCVDSGTKIVDVQSELASGSLGSPRKVNISLLSDLYQPESISMPRKPMPVRAPYPTCRTWTPQVSQLGLNASDSKLISSPAFCNLQAVDERCFAAQTLPPPPGLERMPAPSINNLTELVRPPPGLERIALLQINDRNYVVEHGTSQMELEAGHTSHKCAKHSLSLCNRMLNGKICQSDDCWAKSKLCHAKECCANKVRPRLAPTDRQAAKAIARQAKAELENLEPSLMARRVNEAERGLGYKWRALEKLQACNPQAVPEESRADVVAELQKVAADGSAAYRVREAAAKALEIWQMR